MHKLDIIQYCKQALNGICIIKNKILNIYTVLKIIHLSLKIINFAIFIKVETMVSYLLDNRHFVLKTRPDTRNNVFLGSIQYNFRR